MDAPIPTEAGNNRHTVYLSVGSNMGNRVENCRSGIAGFVSAGSLILLDQSRYYVTEPVDYKDQAWFVNGVIKIQTDLGPTQLLQVIQNVQRAAGRHKDPIRFGPRILDLDILLYDRITIRTDEIEIPHPRMHKRRFVLKPICDIDPKMMHPILNKSMQFLLDQLDDHTQRVSEYS